MAYSLVKKNGNKMGYMYWKVNKKRKQEQCEGLAFIVK